MFSGAATAGDLSSGTVGGVDGAAADGIDGGSLGGIAAAAAHHPLRRSSLLSGERAVFKPVVKRIGSLELQVTIAELCGVDALWCRGCLRESGHAKALPHALCGPR